jgi:hypothetical protein
MNRNKTIPLMMPVGLGAFVALLGLNAGELIGGRAGLWTVGLLLLFAGSFCLLRIRE